ncbi:MAG: glutamate-1-semialdehyde aminotransferase [Omnitrophica bacterium GWA2_41_15]|nr:MAG: glutamate-1-semialdehyde aminotransferase [Omnitrophica bacterium GWA2_41_15]
MVKVTDNMLFKEAVKFIPGGVNSPVRSFKAVGGSPVFIKHAKGSKICSEDNRVFIDYCMSWGALILGHAYPEVIKELENSVKNGTSFGIATRLEIELAELIVKAVPSIEQVRLTNSGTEAVMAAIRLARAYAKKDKIVRFQNSYHGHADYFLNCEGVPLSFKKHTITAPYNDIKNVKELITRHKRDIAAIIVEPVAGNAGVILPEKGFLQDLRKLSDRQGIVLIFDEVITGFRISYGGAQGFFNVKPDLTCMGKIIGGGLPVGAFGGRKDIMKLLAPIGPVYQAGTLSGNPVAVTAGIVTLKALKRLNPYKELEKKTKRLCDGIISRAQDHGVRLKVNNIASMFSVSFEDIELFKRFFHGLLKRKIYFSPSMFETNFLSIVHTGDDIYNTLTAVNESFENLRG